MAETLTLPNLIGSYMDASGAVVDTDGLPPAETAETASDIRRATREKNFRRVSPSWHCRGEITDLLAPVPLLSHGIVDTDDTDESDCLPGLVSGRGGFMTLALMLWTGTLLSIPVIALMGGF